MFWEWKTGRIKSRLRAHSKVVIAHEWLPHETVRPCLPRAFCAVLARRADAVSPFASFSLQSKVVTGSWDGLIKLWVRRVRRFAARQERTDLTFACRTDGQRLCVSYFPICRRVQQYTPRAALPAPRNRATRPAAVWTDERRLIARVRAPAVLFRSRARPALRRRRQRLQAREERIMRAATKKRSAGYIYIRMMRTWGGGARAVKKKRMRKRTLFHVFPRGPRSPRSRRARSGRACRGWWRVATGGCIQGASEPSEPRGACCLSVRPLRRHSP